jgi:hypothetical protein
MMKNFLGICLLLLFLIYNAGYYVFYLTYNIQYENSWRDKVECNELDPGSLITKSIPITLAYQADQKDFLPVLESFEMNGKIYRVLQQRYSKDTLHIVYVNDQKGKLIKNSLRDWVSTLTQKPTSDKSNTVWDSFEKNYMPNFLDFILRAKAPVARVFCIFVDMDVISPYIDTLTPPPKA